MRRFPMTRKVLWWLVSLFVLIAGGLTYYYESMPERNWNENALKKVELYSLMQPDSLTFAVFGDNKDNLAVYDRMLEAVSKETKVCFAIHMGDMVNGGEEETFRHFIRHTRDGFEHPMLTVMGNHEKGEDGRGMYDMIFNPPYYSFAIKQCYFIVIDDALDDSLTRHQMTWLEGELAKAQDYQYRMVFMHIPPFDPRGEDWLHCLSPKKAAPLMAMFKKHGVTHLFTGHIHGYYEGDWKGMHYAISGGAGAEFKKGDPDHNFYHYLLVNVEDGQKPKITLRKVA